MQHQQALALHVVAGQLLACWLGLLLQLLRLGMQLQLLLLVVMQTNHARSDQLLSRRISRQQ